MTTNGGHLSLTTAANGTDWVAYASQRLSRLTVSNQSGTTIEFRQGGAGVGFRVPSGQFFTFHNIGSASDIEARRVDLNTSQVTVTARWEE